METQDLLSDTPFVSVDLDVMENNIKRIAILSAEAGVKLRPHIKTHKSPELAKLQLKYGATGITVAKLGEAEVMFESGINNILIAFPIIGKAKLKRFARLLEKADLTVALDDYKIAKALNDVGEQVKKKVKIYIDIDIGMHRMGRNPEKSIEHILEIAKLPFIKITGLTSHAGHAYKLANDHDIKKIAIEEAEMLFDTKKVLEEENIYVEEISVGTTSTIRFLKDIPYITEARPGMYIFNDKNVIGAGGAAISDCAATVIATVISRPTKNRLVIDAGSKTLSQDPYKEGGFGLIKGYEDLKIINLSEEHGVVEINGDCDLQVGDIVEIIPNHICPVINLRDEIYGFRNGSFEKEILIKGRGKNR